MSQSMELTGDMLTTLLPKGLLFRGYVSDLDECKQWGCYLTNAATVCVSPPPGWTYWRYSNVAVMERGTMVTQIISHNIHGIAVRWFADEAWGPWRQLSFVTS